MNRITIYSYLNSIKPFFQRAEISVPVEPKKITKTHKEVELFASPAAGGGGYVFTEFKPTIKGGGYKTINIIPYDV